MQTTTAPAYAVGSDGESQHKEKIVPKLRKLGVLSFARFQAALTALLGVLAWLVNSVGGAIYDLLTIGLNLGTALAFLALIGMPIIFAVFGFVVGIVEAVIYNVVASRFGGLEVKFG